MRRVSLLVTLFLLALALPLSAQKEPEPSLLCPPAPFVARLVAVYIDDDVPIVHRYELPGAPSSVECTSSYDPTWCRNADCGPLDPGSVACDGAEITTCHVVLLAANGSIRFLAPVPASACP